MDSSQELLHNSLLQNQSGSMRCLKRQLSSAKDDHKTYNEKHNASGKLKEQLKSATETFDKLQREMNERYPEYRLNIVKNKQYLEKINQLQTRIEQGDHERMAHLRRMHPDSFKAVTWVRNIDELFS